MISSISSNQLTLQELVDQVIERTLATGGPTGGRHDLCCGMAEQRSYGTQAHSGSALSGPGGLVASSVDGHLWHR
ncbi:MAG TPA: hypothetical protein VHA33_13505 [Candidatus Angelobacter sp.]|jgi:hypothetical protein|nr:hypothetical protein [Candidatus Angelobacter sp.]